MLEQVWGQLCRDALPVGLARSPVLVLFSGPGNAKRERNEKAAWYREHIFITSSEMQTV